MKQTTSLKARALRYLSTREYSRKELEERLLGFVQEGDHLDALLDWLIQKGFLSDARFAESLVRRRAGRYGNGRIRQELHRYQVMEALPDTVMQTLLEDEGARAQAVWERKFGVMPADMKERARQVRFLQQRGFSSDVIQRVMKDKKV